MSNNKPTVAYVQGLRAAYEPVHQKAWANMKYAEDLRTGAYTTIVGEAPPDLVEYKPSGPLTRVNRFTDYIIPYNPTVRVEPKTKKDADIRRANAIEGGCSEFWKQLTRSSSVHPIREAAKFAAVRGVFWIKGLLLDAEFVGEEPKREKGEKTATYARRLARWKMRKMNTFPYALKAVDPMYRMLHPIMDSMTPPWTLEIYPMDIEDARLACPKWEPSPSDLRNAPSGEKQATSGQIEVQEFWTDNWRMVFIENKVVPMENEDGDVEEVLQNIMGQVPYRMGYLGYGLSTNSIKDKDQNTAEASRAVSMIGAVAGDIIREARAVTAQNQHFNRFINAGRQADVEDFSRAEEALEAHALVNVGAQHKGIFPIEVPEYPQFGKEALDDARSAQEFGMISNILFGYGDAKSGYERLQLREDAGRVFIHLRETLRSTMAQISQDWVYINKHILPLLGKNNQQPLWASEDSDSDASGVQRSVRWAEIEDDTRFDIIFPNEDKTAAAQDADTALKWLKEGALSRAEALEKGGRVQDSEKSVFEADVDRALQGLMPAIVEEGAALFQVKSMLADVQEAAAKMKPAPVNIPPPPQDGVGGFEGVPTGGPMAGMPVPPPAQGSPEDMALIQAQQVGQPPAPEGA